MHEGSSNGIVERVSGCTSEIVRGACHFLKIQSGHRQQGNRRRHLSPVPGERPASRPHKRKVRGHAHLRVGSHPSACGGASITSVRPALTPSLEKSHASSYDSFGNIYPSSDLGIGVGAGAAISL